MKPSFREEWRQRNRERSQNSSIFNLSRYGISWTVGAFATVMLIGGALGIGLFDRGSFVAMPAATTADRIVLTSDTAPPALWSNAWLGRRPYRSTVFHGLHRLAAGFTFHLPPRPLTFRQDLMRIGPNMVARFVQWRRDIKAYGKWALVSRNWL